VLTAVLFASVAILASAVWLLRGMRARAAKRKHATGPGTSLASAIPVRSFEQIDEAVRARRCHCGERLRLRGEGARHEGTQRYRIARLACDECEEDSVLYFDVSEVLH
jgi:hypothetical protein